MIVNSNPKPVGTFPKLMACGETVVLFTAYGVGTVLAEGTGSYDLGCYRENWSMSNFVDYTDVLSLQND